MTGLLDEDELLNVSNDMVQAVVRNIMANDGSPVMDSCVRKALRALVRLGWNGWPEPWDSP